jgi:peroxiredoxin
MRNGVLPVLAVLAALDAVAGPPPAAVPGAPALTVQTLTGDDFDLAKLRGRVVLVHFWATWCPPCLEEMPEIEVFHARFHERGVEVIAMSQDRSRDVEDVKRLVRRLGISYPVAMAHRAVRNGFGEQSALPVTFVIDAKGIVRAEMRPDKQPVTVESLAKVVEPLLAPP